MMKWFYDSLETLQKVEFATKKDYRTLGIGVFVSVVLFGAFFIGIDTLGSGIYKWAYNTARWSDYQIQQELENTDQNLLDEDDSLLEGVEVETLDGEEDSAWLLLGTWTQQ